MDYLIFYEILGEFFNFNLFRFISIFIITLLGSFFFISMFRIDGVDFKAIYKKTKISTYEAIFGGIIGFSLMTGWPLNEFFMVFTIILLIQIISLILLGIKIWHTFRSIF
jgi:hypothetical protein